MFHSGFSSRHSRGDLVSGKIASSSASASASSASALTRESLGDDDQDQTQQSSSNPSPSPYTDDADEHILRWTARIGGVAAIGAAGIPEAGLVTMLIVLNAAELPVEYIGLILMDLNQ